MDNKVILLRNYIPGHLLCSGAHVLSTTIKDQSVLPRVHQVLLVKKIETSLSKGR